MIIDYGGVTATLLGDLIESVQLAISNGWQPWGDMVVSPDGRFYQMLVLENRRNAKKDFDTMLKVSGG